MARGNQTLTDEEREIIINAMVETGAIREEDAEGLSQISDTLLINLGSSALIENDEADPDDDHLSIEEMDDDDYEDDDDDDYEDDDDDEELATNEKHLCTNCAGTSREPATAEEWMESAPPEIAEVVGNAMRFAEEQRQALIEQLVANSPANRRTSAVKYFSQYPLSQLRELAAVIPTQNSATEPTSVPGMKRVNYAGASGGPSPTVNRKKTTDESSLLVPPTINWAELSSEFGGKPKS